MAEPFIAEIRGTSFNFAPKGWALCNGQLLPINQNQALFSLLGTTYGGDGRVNFGLPNLQGRVPVHMGNGVTLGQSAGEEAHTLSISEMPAHNHIVQGNNTNGLANVAGITPDSTKTIAQGLVSQQSGGTTPAQIYGTGTPDRTMSAATIGSTGGGLAHENRQPFSVISYIIALQGIFPEPELMRPTPLPIDPALAARGIDLRREVPEDADFLRALYREARAAEFAHVALLDQAKRRLLDDQFQLQRRHFTASRPDADFLIITREARAIGRLYVDRGGPHWRLMEISLTACEQGGGTGSALIGSLMAGAATAGAAGIDLHVAIDNRRAEALYRRLGFVAAAASEAAASHRRLIWQAVS